MPHIVGPVTHASRFAGDSPRLAPRTHWTGEIDVVEDGKARVPSQTYFCGRGRGSYPALLQRIVRATVKDKRTRGARAESRGPYLPLSYSSARLFRRAESSRPSMRAINPERDQDEGEERRGSALARSGKQVGFHFVWNGTSYVAALRKRSHAVSNRPQRPNCRKMPRSAPVS